MLHRLEVIGDAEAAPKFAIPSQRYTDYNLLTNEKAGQKIFRAFSKTPYDFDISVLFSKNAGGSAVRKHPLVAEMVAEDNKIKLVYSNNITSVSNYVPMTSWILVHRSMHADLSGTFGMLRCMKPYLVDIMTEVFANYPKIASFLRSIRNAITGDLDTYPEFMWLINRFFSMKSARDNRLQNNLDVPAEMVAQFVISGTVRFNRFQNWNKIDNDEFFDKFDFKMNDNLDIALIDLLIEKAEIAANEACKQQLDSMVGKVWCF